MTDYKQLYDIMVIDESKTNALNALVGKIKANEPTYQIVSNNTNVPWSIISVIHYRESELSFKHHLHNGDPLIARTVHVPTGRPAKGEPPFTWQDSAIDALKMKGWHEVTDWSIPNALQLIEKYNGLGYKKKGLPSPYLWSWSQNYQKGKYVADGKFDPNVVDQQCGTAVLLKLLV